MYALVITAANVHALIMPQQLPIGSLVSNALLGVLSLRRVLHQYFVRNVSFSQPDWR